MEKKEEAPKPVVRPVVKPAAPAPQPAAPAQAAAPAASKAAGRGVKSPLPGVIIDVKVNVGDQVKKGQTVIILEAMKMENNINADQDGTITAINVKQGDSVLEGTDLVLIGLKRTVHLWENLFHSSPTTWQTFGTYTGFCNATPGHLVMILVGLFFIYLAISKEFEPMLLIPIGFGILIGNIPFNIEAGLKVGIYEEGSVLNILYQGVTSGWYPPLIFLGIGAMTDFSALISNPKLLLIGAAAQFGILAHT